MKGPVIVEDTCLSIAWAQGFLELLDPGVTEIQPMVVVVTGFANGTPLEDQSIRDLLEEGLAAREMRSCHTVANTIFPLTMWLHADSRTDLYTRYLRLLPRLKRRRANQNGTYFERLISFGNDHVNQLEHIITTWTRGNHRRSALQASVFDPQRDHTHQRQRGFPCLQQVAFAPHGVNGLSVTGFYATQYMFERAYGNYLGLCRLGQYVAAHLDKSLTRMVCISGIAQLDTLSRAEAKPLGEALSQLLE